jgi:hypothetical protein
LGSQIWQGQKATKQARLANTLEAKDISLVNLTTELKDNFVKPGQRFEFQIDAITSSGTLNSFGSGKTPSSEWIITTEGLQRDSNVVTVLPLADLKVNEVKITAKSKFGNGPTATLVYPIAKPCRVAIKGGPKTFVSGRNNTFEAGLIYTDSSFESSSDLAKAVVATSSAGSYQGSAFSIGKGQEVVPGGSVTLELNQPTLKLQAKYVLNQSFGEKFAYNFSGASGNSGNGGLSGSSCSSSQSATDGGSGKDGTNGKDGEEVKVWITVAPAVPGQPTLCIARIKSATDEYYRLFDPAKAELAVYAEGGAGGRGGAGGTGGYCSDAVGGDGGDAGDGGDGGDGGEIDVLISPAAQKLNPKLTFSTVAGSPGQGGYGGTGSGSTSGQSGSRGQDGQKGSEGTDGGAADIEVVAVDFPIPK